MSVSLPLDELLDYSDHERRKWQQWLAADPSRAQVTLQGSGRFPTVAALLDHIVLTERRHLARLEGATPPESTGVPAGDMSALFEYARLVREDLRQYLHALDEAGAAEAMAVNVASGHFTMPRRRLCAHILLHEMRHLAQLALAARLAGIEPPGEHDLFYFQKGVADR